LRDEEGVVGEFSTHQRWGNDPRIRILILPKHLVEVAVKACLTEGTVARFKTLPHLLVLFVAAAPFETEKLLIGEHMFAHRRVLFNMNFKTVRIVFQSGIKCKPNSATVSSCIPVSLSDPQYHRRAPPRLSAARASAQHCCRCSRLHQNA